MLAVRKVYFLKKLALQQRGKVENVNRFLENCL